MQISVRVRLYDVISFYIDSLTRELSAMAIFGTLSTLFVAILAQAYIRGGPDVLFTTAITTVAIAFSCAALFYGGIALMVIANRSQNQPTGDLVYEISAQGVAVRTTERLFKYPWDEITDIGYSDRFVWVHIDDQHYRFVPRASLESDEQLTSVWNALEKPARAG